MCECVDLNVQRVVFLSSFVSLLHLDFMNQRKKRENFVIQRNFIENTLRLTPRRIRETDTFLDS